MNPLDKDAVLSQLQQLTDKAFSLLCSNMQADMEKLLDQKLLQKQGLAELMVTQDAVPGSGK